MGWEAFRPGPSYISVEKILVLPGETGFSGVYFMHIAVVGSGYVGLVAGACFAELGHEVFLVDNDPRKLAVLEAGGVPIHEEYLPELLAKHRGKRIRFTANLGEAVQACEAIFVAVGTPPTEEGDADLSFVESVAQGVAGAINGYKVVVEKSTVPVYTNEWIRKVMLLNRIAPESFDVCSNPEFLREGTAVTDFLYPDRIVVGANTEQALAVLRAVYKPLTDGSYYQQADIIPAPKNAPAIPPPLIETSAKSAEMIKHASNAFLAMKISFVNAVACMCEEVGANIEQVVAGVGSDARIGPRFLAPGIGYGGSCFPKDVLAFRAVARDCSYDFRLLDEVVKINDEQRKRFLNKVRSALWTLRGKRLGVLGLAFKGGTDDIRESPAIMIVQALLREGCSIRAYDPAAMERAKEELPAAVEFATDSYDAAKDADALLILTEWTDFANLDLKRLYGLLRYPIVIDGRNLYRRQMMKQAGFTYHSVGRETIAPDDPSIEAEHARNAGA